MSEKKQARNGKLASTSTRKNSANETIARNTELSRLLASVYNHYQKLDDATANKVCRRDFVFHMSDWADDLRNLAALYDRPEQFSKAQAERIIAAFLYHGTAHIMEASRLLLDYEPGYFFDSAKPRKTKEILKPSRG